MNLFKQYQAAYDFFFTSGEIPIYVAIKKNIVHSYQSMWIYLQTKA